LIQISDDVAAQPFHQIDPKVPGACAGPAAEIETQGGAPLQFLGNDWIDDFHERLSLACCTLAKNA
jgi:hypothetical protein